LSSNPAGQSILCVRDCEFPLRSEDKSLSDTIFQRGEAVVLFKGSNIGTPGTFLDLRQDQKWADIEEQGGMVRQHPVEWLKHQA
jgi:hypothetical protein